MKKFDVKSLVVGLIIGMVGITTVFAASGIKSAVFSNAKITLDGHSVPLTKSLIAVVKDNEKDASLYMPVRELMEYIGYNVNWNKETLTVELSKDLADKKIVPNTTDTSAELSQQKNIDINIEQELTANGYVIIGEYTLTVGSTVRFDITAEGLGNLQVGFIRPTDTPSTAKLMILTRSNSNKNGKCLIQESEGKVVTEEMAGHYKLFIRNTGNESLSNIKGTVLIDE